MTNKIIALAEFLEVEVIDITKSDYSDNVFEVNENEYLVLTDEEAKEETTNYINETVWAFNSDFIINHSSALDYDEPSRMIVRVIGEQCESGNEAMKKLIDDMDEFIIDAIELDGRGHFLSSYDGVENEHGEFFIYQV